MRLIDIEPYKDGKIVYNDEDHGIKIKDLPVVDAVEVVRCKDCIYAAKDPIIDGAYSCWILANGCCVIADSFCSFGKRREDTACDECNLTRWTETEETK